MQRTQQSVCQTLVGVAEDEVFGKVHKEILNQQMSHQSEDCEQGKIWWFVDETGMEDLGIAGVLVIEDAELLKGAVES